MSETGVKIDLPEGLEPSLDELFNRDPLKSWSKEDRIKVIQHLRETRKIFMKEETQARSKSKRVDAKKAIATGGAKNLTLKDLGLDL